MKRTPEGQAEPKESFEPLAKLASFIAKPTQAGLLDGRSVSNVLKQAREDWLFVKGLLLMPDKVLARVVKIRLRISGDEECPPADLTFLQGITDRGRRQAEEEYQESLRDAWADDVHQGGRW